MRISDRGGAVPVFIAIGWAFGALLYAQTTSTEVLGLVTDSSGAAVPGAAVTLTRLTTGEKRSATTNAAGEYSFPLIEIGDYRVHVEMAGFKSETVSRLHVELQQKARVNFALEVGQLSESIEVRANAVALKTEDASVGQVIDNKRVVELPLNGRNVQSLAVLVPGVQFGLRTGLGDGQGGVPIPGAGISVSANGQREMNQTITLDGVDAKEPKYNTMVFSPSIEAIEEFKVQTSSYSAEYGLNGGAIVQISMKSGGNDLHGTLFEFLRNDKLDAEDYFLNFENPAGSARLPKDRLRRNQFGAVLSGPVTLPLYNGRNRTFWAFDYEGRRETTERVSTAWFPNQSFRNGDFSALLAPAVNPQTGKPFRAPIVLFDPVLGQPFANNVIPPSRLHPGAQNVLKLLPPPQFQQADLLDFTNRAAVPDKIRQNQYFWRLDHIFRPGDKVFVRYAADRSGLDKGSINPNFPYFVTSQATNLASQWVHIFNQNTINELRFGFNVSDQDVFNPRTNTDFDLDSLGVGKFRVVTDNNRKLKPGEAGIPPMGFTIGDERGSSDRLKTYMFGDNITLIRGKHGFKTGFEYQRVSVFRAAANTPRGSLAFSGNESGLAFASFVLGYPDATATGEGFPLALPRANRGGAYFLDEWKVTPRLTLNAGLRWDFFGVPVDSGGFWRTLDFSRTFTTPDGSKIPTIYPPKVGSDGSVSLWNQENRFFMPRVGIAFRPADKWVIRAGGGWFANVEHMVVFTILSLMPPLSGSQSFNTVTDVAGATSVNLGGVPYNSTLRRFRPATPILTLDDPFAGSARLRPVNLTHVQPNHRNSNHYQWSFDVQRQLPANVALTVGYVGSHSLNIGNSIGNFNTARPSPDTNFQRRRPYQSFYDDGRIQDLGDVRYLDSYASGWYNGLQVSAEKRYSHGLVMGMAYTFSKALGEGEAGGNEDSGFQDPLDRRGSKARYQFDQRHNMVVNFVYELPFAKNYRGLGGVLLKGWQMNGILSLRSGFPFTLTGGDLNTGGGTIRPDRIADGRLDSDRRSRKQWYDTSAFRRVSCNIPGRPDLCHYGSAGRNILESPGQRNLDAALFKNFSFGERMTLQFRSEFFNALNTPYFGQPNGVSFQTVDSIVPDGPRDGEIRSLRTPMRIIQFGLKLRF